MTDQPKPKNSPKAKHLAKALQRNIIKRKQQAEGRAVAENTPKNPSSMP
jgi:hypothetical protein